MSTHFVFDGLPDLLRALRSLPEELSAEARAIVERKTHDAYAIIYAGYPERTGRLRKGLRAHVEQLGVSVIGTVTNAAKTKDGQALAQIFESGAQGRHTDLGWSRGSVPPNPIFSQTLSRKRKEMYEELRALLRANGLEVSG